jgi:hypothetical protein
MPSQSIRPALPPSLMSRRHRKDLPIIILGKGRQSRCHGRTYQPSIKIAAMELQYPTNKGIPIMQINMHSLQSGGANALALVGYSNMQIQKMGRWRGATFKEYIREELACYARGVLQDMKQKFDFVNIAGNEFTEIPDNTSTLSNSTSNNVGMPSRQHYLQTGEYTSYTLHPLVMIPHNGCTSTDWPPVLYISIVNAIPSR